MLCESVIRKFTGGKEMFNWRIEELREKLYLAIDANADSIIILAISEELDKCIVEYMKTNNKFQL